MKQEQRKRKVCARILRLRQITFTLVFQFLSSTSTLVFASLVCVGALQVKLPIIPYLDVKFIEAC